MAAGLERLSDNSGLDSGTVSAAGIFERDMKTALAVFGVMVLAAGVCADEVRFGILAHDIADRLGYTRIEGACLVHCAGRPTVEEVQTEHLQSKGWGLAQQRVEARHDKA